MNETECYVRSKSFLGSINFWPSKMTWGGPISDDPVYNPDFSNWTHLFFPYCDGACFSGNKEDPLVVNNTNVYFRGHRILEAAFKDILETKGFDQATEVLLVGDSAGGMATYYQADWIKQFMPPSVKKFKAVPFSGIFLDRPNAEGTFVFGPMLEYAYRLQESVGNQKCAEANPDDKYKCFLPQYVMEYIETPLFVMNSAYDLVAIQCIVAGEPLITYSQGTGNCSAVPGWRECSLDVANCTLDQWAKIEEYATYFRVIVENNPVVTKVGNGLYEHSCIIHDVEPDYGWNHFVVRDTLLRDAVRDWFLSDNDPAFRHTYKDCDNGFDTECNPTCKKPSSSSSSSVSSSVKPSSTSSASSSVKPSSTSSASSSVKPSSTSSTTPVSSSKPLSASSNDDDNGPGAGWIAAVVILSVLLAVAIVVIIGILVWHSRSAQNKSTSYTSISDPLMQ